MSPKSTVTYSESISRTNQARIDVDSPAADRQVYLTTNSFPRRKESLRLDRERGLIIIAYKCKYRFVNDARASINVMRNDRVIRKRVSRNGRLNQPRSLEPVP